MFVRNKCAFNFDSNIRREGTKISIIELFVSISLKRIMSTPRQSEAFVSIGDARLYLGKCLLTAIDDCSGGFCIQ